MKEKSGKKTSLKTKQNKKASGKTGKDNGFGRRDETIPLATILRSERVENGGAMMEYQRLNTDDIVQRS